MAAEANKQARPRVSATLPPRTLNVQKFAESRASELESLHLILANRLNNDFRSRRNKRRRTTGHDNRVAKNKWKKRRRLGPIEKCDTVTSEIDHKMVPRRIRRRIELRKNPGSGFCTSGDGTKRLRTHLWHAKRFTMTKQWGFHLPLGLQGRGRGSRALLKWFKHGALVHDASYCCAVQLEGPEDSLLSILRMVLVPTPPVLLEEISQSVLSGVSYERAMLHHVGAHVSQPIGPVTYMWRPLSSQKIGIDAEKDLTTDGYIKSKSSTGSSSFRQLWVWIHAAALTEGYDTLKFACQKLMDETGNLVKCSSREGQLGRLEVMGSKAIQILLKILRPASDVCSVSETYSPMKKCSGLKSVIDPQLQKSLILEHVEHLPSYAILSLSVHDPRNLSEKRSEDILEVPSASVEDDVIEDESEEHVAFIKSPNNNEELFSSLWFRPEENSALFSDSKGLWDTSNEMSNPVDENILCMEKHQRRLAFFNLDSTKSGTVTDEVKEQSSRSCPILLLKNNNQRSSCIGWSIILPLSWVKAFWVPLVSYGACAIGLREKHWIACDVGLPSFPFDFPDCKAYSCFMATEAVAADKRAELRPLAMRPLRVPIPPPWDSVKFAFREVPTTMEIQTANGKTCNGEMVPENSLVQSDVGSTSTSLEVDPSFEGFVARTSNLLSIYLNEAHGGHLLLFPDAPKNRGGFSKLMKDEGKLMGDSKGAIQISVDQKLCFLRVFLHAYKEGTFEEGSVVCAPRLTDLSLWTSRSDQDAGLQIPQSSIRSYFKQQPSGKWELQMPENPVARESHRWPIGFVTTGFVRGSKKPVAEALCEATLLALLRGEQWNEIPDKRRRREIYVLVRNLRSTAYRLALATIVLELQKEDVEFM